MERDSSSATPFSSTDGPVEHPDSQETRELRRSSVPEEGDGQDDGHSPLRTGEAVLEAVKEVYAPFLDEAAPQAPPGRADELLSLVL